MKKQPLFFNRSFDKKALKQLVLWSVSSYGSPITTDFIEKLKDLSFYYATKAGVSLTIDDLKIPPGKKLILSNANRQMFENEERFYVGQLHLIKKFEQNLEIWNTASELLKNEALLYFRKTDLVNPIYMMAFSGARGNMSQVRQLVGMRGLMVNTQGDLIELPILSNFREGLTLTEYIISCYGARKGLIDTALRTANAGYLTRRLVDVAHNVIIRSHNCKTQKGILIDSLFNEEGVIMSCRDRLLGRVLAKPFWDKNVLIAPKDEPIDFKLATLLSAQKTKDYQVRSPLVCNEHVGMCVLCYGWSLDHGRFVHIGEAVGILAAQSIGEPGTQLTLRTFHTGGAFSGKIVDRFYAPFSGFTSYSINDLSEKIISQKKYYITSNPKKVYINQKEFLLPPSTIIYVLPNTYTFEKQVIAEVFIPNSQGSLGLNKSQSASLLKRSVSKNTAKMLIFSGRKFCLDEKNSFFFKTSTSRKGKNENLICKLLYYNFTINQYLSSNLDQNKNKKSVNFYKYKPGKLPGFSISTYQKISCLTSKPIESFALLYGQAKNIRFCNIRKLELYHKSDTFLTNPYPFLTNKVKEHTFESILSQVNTIDDKMLSLYFPAKLQSHELIKQSRNWHLFLGLKINIQKFIKAQEFIKWPENEFLKSIFILLFQRKKCLNVQVFSNFPIIRYLLFLKRPLSLTCPPVVYLRQRMALLKPTSLPWGESVEVSSLTTLQNSNSLWDQKIWSMETIGDLKSLLLSIPKERKFNINKRICWPKRQEFLETSILRSSRNQNRKVIKNSRFCTKKSNLNSIFQKPYPKLPSTLPANTVSQIEFNSKDLAKLRENVLHPIHKNKNNSQKSKKRKITKDSEPNKILVFNDYEQDLKVQSKKESKDLISDPNFQFFIRQTSQSNYLSLRNLPNRSLAFLLSCPLFCVLRYQALLEQLNIVKQSLKNVAPQHISNFFENNFIPFQSKSQLKLKTLSLFAKDPKRANNLPWKFRAPKSNCQNKLANHSPIALWPTSSARGAMKVHLQGGKLPLTAKRNHIRIRIQFEFSKSFQKSFNRIYFVYQNNKFRRGVQNSFHDKNFPIIMNRIQKIVKQWQLALVQIDNKPTKNKRKSFARKLQIKSFKIEQLLEFKSQVKVLKFIRIQQNLFHFKTYKNKQILVSPNQIENDSKNFFQLLNSNQNQNKNKKIKSWWYYYYDIQNSTCKSFFNSSRVAFEPSIKLNINTILNYEKVGINCFQINQKKLLSKLSFRNSQQSIGFYCQNKTQSRFNSSFEIDSFGESEGLNSRSQSRASRASRASLPLGAVGNHQEAPSRNLSLNNRRQFISSLSTKKRISQILKKNLSLTQKTIDSIFFPAKIIFFLIPYSFNFDYTLLNHNLNELKINEVKNESKKLSKFLLKLRKRIYLPQYLFSLYYLYNKNKYSKSSVTKAISPFETKNKKFFIRQTKDKRKLCVASHIFFDGLQKLLIVYDESIFINQQKLSLMSVFVKKDSPKFKFGRWKEFSSVHITENEFERSKRSQGKGSSSQNYLLTLNKDSAKEITNINLETKRIQFLTLCYDSQYFNHEIISRNLEVLNQSFFVPTNTFNQSNKKTRNLKSNFKSNIDRESLRKEILNINENIVSSGNLIFKDESFYPLICQQINHNRSLSKEKDIQKVSSIKGEPPSTLDSPYTRKEVDGLTVFSFDFSRPIKMRRKKMRRKEQIKKLLKSFSFDAHSKSVLLSKKNKRNSKQISSLFSSFFEKELFKSYNPSQVSLILPDKVFFNKAEIYSRKFVIKVKNTKIVNLVSKGTILVEASYVRQKTADIIQGLPKIEQLLEARSMTNEQIIPNNPNLQIELGFQKHSQTSKPSSLYFKKPSLFRFLKLNILQIKNKQVSKLGFETKKDSRWLEKSVQSKFLLPKLNKGESLGEGFRQPEALQPEALQPGRSRSSLSTQQSKEIVGDLLNTLIRNNLFFSKNRTRIPNEFVFEIMDRIQCYIVDNVQSVYQSQGVEIADKHVEIIVRQMTSKVIVKNSQKTSFLSGEFIDRTQFNHFCSHKLFSGALFEPIILGLTRTSLNSDSFLSAASFQETTRVLTKAAFYGKHDWLQGLKEKVVLGQLLNAGTSLFETSTIPQWFQKQPNWPLCDETLAGFAEPPLGAKNILLSGYSGDEKKSFYNNKINSINCFDCNQVKPKFFRKVLLNSSQETSISFNSKLRYRFQRIQYLLEENRRFEKFYDTFILPEKQSKSNDNQSQGSAGFGLGGFAEPPITQKEESEICLYEQEIPMNFLHEILFFSFCKLVHYNQPLFYNLLIKNSIALSESKFSFFLNSAYILDRILRFSTSSTNLFKYEAGNTASISTKKVFISQDKEKRIDLKDLKPTRKQIFFNHSKDIAFLSRYSNPQVFEDYKKQKSKFLKFYQYSDLRKLFKILSEFKQKTLFEFQSTIHKNQESLYDRTVFLNSIPIIFNLIKSQFLKKLENFSLISNAQKLDLLYTKSKFSSIYAIWLDCPWQDFYDFFEFIYFLSENKVNKKGVLFFQKQLSPSLYGFKNKFEIKKNFLSSSNIQTIQFLNKKSVTDEQVLKNSFNSFASKTLSVKQHKLKGIPKNKHAIRRFLFKNYHFKPGTKSSNLKNYYWNQLLLNSNLQIALSTRKKVLIKREFFLYRFLTKAPRGYQSGSLDKPNKDFQKYWLKKRQIIFYSHIFYSSSASTSRSARLSGNSPLKSFKIIRILKTFCYFWVLLNFDKLLCNISAGNFYLKASTITRQLSLNLLKIFNENKQSQFSSKKGGKQKFTKLTNKFEQSLFFCIVGYDNLTAPNQGLSKLFFISLQMTQRKSIINAKNIEPLQRNIFELDFGFKKLNFYKYFEIDKFKSIFFTQLQQKFHTNKIQIRLQRLNSTLNQRNFLRILKWLENQNQNFDLLVLTSFIYQKKFFELPQYLESFLFFVEKMEEFFITGVIDRNENSNLSNQKLDTESSLRLNPMKFFIQTKTYNKVILSSYKNPFFFKSQKQLFIPKNIVQDYFLYIFKKDSTELKLQKKALNWFKRSGSVTNLSEFRLREIFIKHLYLYKTQISSQKQHYIQFQKKNIWNQYQLSYQKLKNLKSQVSLKRLKFYLHKTSIDLNLTQNPRFNKNNNLSYYNSSKKLQNFYTLRRFCYSQEYKTVFLQNKFDSSLSQELSKLQKELNAYPQHNFNLEAKGRLGEALQGGFGEPLLGPRQAPSLPPSFHRNQKTLASLFFNTSIDTLWNDRILGLRGARSNSLIEADYYRQSLIINENPSIVSFTALNLKNSIKKRYLGNKNLNLIFEIRKNITFISIFYTFQHLKLSFKKIIRSLDAKDLSKNHPKNDQSGVLTLFNIQVYRKLRYHVATGTQEVVETYTEKKTQFDFAYKVSKLFKFLIDIYKSENLVKMNYFHLSDEQSQNKSLNQLQRIEFVSKFCSDILTLEFIHANEFKRRFFKDRTFINFINNQQNINFINNQQNSRDFENPLRIEDLLMRIRLKKQFDNSIQVDNLTIKPTKKPLFYFLNFICGKFSNNRMNVQVYLNFDLFNPAISERKNLQKIEEFQQTFNILEPEINYKVFLKITKTFLLALEKRQKIIFLKVLILRFSDKTL